MKVTSKQELQLYAMMALLAGGSMLNKRTTAVKVKPCIACGVEHTHHNDFCSRECCFRYKGKERAMNNLKLRAACE